MINIHAMPTRTVSRDGITITYTEINGQVSCRQPRRIEFDVYGQHVALDIPGHAHPEYISVDAQFAIAHTYKVFEEVVNRPK